MTGPAVRFPKPAYFYMTHTSKGAAGFPVRPCEHCSKPVERWNEPCVRVPLAVGK